MASAARRVSLLLVVALPLLVLCNSHPPNTLVEVHPNGEQSWDQQQLDDAASATQTDDVQRHRLVRRQDAISPGDASTSLPTEAKEKSNLVEKPDKTNPKLWKDTKDKDILKKSKEVSKSLKKEEKKQKAKADAKSKAADPPPAADAAPVKDAAPKASANATSKETNTTGKKTTAKKQAPVKKGFSMMSVLAVGFLGVIGWGAAAAFYMQLQELQEKMKKASAEGGAADGQDPNQQWEQQPQGGEAQWQQ
eukprot:TRINITY_DN6092_c1_g1_i1.p1 TRINITY_DN6092_c1_g1~~TRINITY_DN6092_c1_g1_i1.p1  ORF type:complete len:250 (+),score=81.27 TRINITY_DN6092_c1_g1_i1:41-790(+)